jgi:uroporphyrinogen-III synthase
MPALRALGLRNVRLPDEAARALFRASRAEPAPRLRALAVEGAGLTPAAARALAASGWRLEELDLSRNLCLGVAFYERSHLGGCSAPAIHSTSVCHYYHAFSFSRMHITARVSLNRLSSNLRYILRVQKPRLPLSVAEIEDQPRGRSA